MKKLLLGTRNEVVREAISAIKKFGLILTSVRVYSSGMVAPYFFDLDHSTTPESFKKIGDGYLEQIQRLNEIYNIDKLAFMEKENATIGAITFAAYLSVQTGIPIVYVRLGRESPYKIKGFDKDTGKVISNGENVVLVGDNTTLGGELLKATNIIRMAGGSVNYAIVYTSRNYEGRKRLLENGVTVLYQISEKELLEGNAITIDKIRYETSGSAVNIAATSGIEV